MLFLIARYQGRCIPAGDSEIHGVGATEPVGGCEFGRLPGHRRSYRNEGQVRESGSRGGVTESAGAVVTRSSHGRYNFRQKQRRHNDWVAACLDPGEDCKALQVTFFVRIERVHKNTRVDRIPLVARTRRPDDLARSALSGGHPTVASRRGGPRRSPPDETAVRDVVPHA